MYAAGHSYSLIKQNEVEKIIHSALRILDEMGMQVDHSLLLNRLAQAGLTVDFASQRVRFPVRWVEDWIAGCEKFDWENVQPQVSASAGVYFSQVQDPETRRLVPWTEDRLAGYIALARSLPHVGSASLLGSRMECLPVLEPLYERYYAWKWGAQEGGSVALDELCPHLLELYETAASFRQKPLQEVFHATVYLVPALKLGRHEAYQVAYFLERGLKVTIGGSMMTMGANAPVTLAGAVTLNLAEQLALRILDDVFFNNRWLGIFSSIAQLDMRTTIRPFGRPEMALANLMTAQVARNLGAAFSGHAALTDAKLPSAEAGFQKALSAIPTLLAGGNLWMDAGLMAIDEVCSPIQMVLDNEFLSALKLFTRELPVDEEAIGLEMILAAGPGGSYVAEQHTARHFRRSLWQPTIWSREMLAVWENHGSKLDADKAAEQVLSVGRAGSPTLQPFIDDAFQQAILDVIERTKKALTT